MNFVLDTFPWLTTIAAWFMLAWAAVRYGTGGARVRWPLVAFLLRPTFHEAAWFVVGVRVASALLLTAAQYHLWVQDPFTASFLRTPLDASLPLSVVHWFPRLSETPFGYFLFYSWGRFWFAAVLSVGVALLFWWFLRALQRHNGRFFLPGETDMGLLVALLVGWPNVVVFIPLVFLGVVFVYNVRLLVFRERLTTLGWPFVLAAAVTLVWGPRFIELVGLAVLRV